MNDGYPTVDFGRWCFHLCIGEHPASGPETGRIRGDECPTSWGVRLYNGRDDQMMTMMPPNPLLTDDQQIRDQPAWGQPELCDLRANYLWLDPGPFNRSSKGFRHKKSTDSSAAGDAAAVPSYLIIGGHR